MQADISSPYPVFSLVSQGPKLPSGGQLREFIFVLENRLLTLNGDHFKRNSAICPVRKRKLHAETGGLAPLRFKWKPKVIVIELTLRVAIIKNEKNQSAMSGLLFLRTIIQQPKRITLSHLGHSL